MSENLPANAEAEFVIAVEDYLRAVGSLDDPWVAAEKLRRIDDAIAEGWRVHLASTSPQW